MTDYDSPWKEALQHFLKSFLAFFFPKCHDAIDWSRKYESLDKELQKIVPKSEVGNRSADKLFKVWRLDGEEAWVLIHVEVQSQAEAGFAERMYVYNYRVFDQFRRPVVSLAVLADDQASWKPRSFSYELWDCAVRLDFPVAKLLDFAGDLTNLESNENPFALIVLAHLQTLATRTDPESRKAWKLRVVKGLLTRGWAASVIRQTFRLIDWLMELPEALDKQFANEIHEFEEAKKMKYVTSVERVALKRGRREEGREEGFETALRGTALALKLKFDAAGLELLPYLEKARSLDLLRSVQDAISRGASLEEVRELLR